MSRDELIEILSPLLEEGFSRAEILIEIDKHLNERSE